MRDRQRVDGPFDVGQIDTDGRCGACFKGLRECVTRFSSAASMSLPHYLVVR